VLINPFSFLISFEFYSCTSKGEGQVIFPFINEKTVLLRFIFPQSPVEEKRIYIGLLTRSLLLLDFATLPKTTGTKKTTYSFMK
jgi:hypothetical protein